MNFIKKIVIIFLLVFGFIFGIYGIGILYDIIIFMNGER